MFGKYITKTLKTSLVFVILFSMFYSMSSADSWTTIGTGPIGGGDGSPTIASVDPASGYNNSTTTVVITGTNLSDVSSLDIGGVPVSSFNIDSATQITAVIQAGLTPAAYHITATNPSGTSDQTAADIFTVLNSSSQVPTVTNVNPNTGVNTGATTVVVTGTNFTGATAVKLGTTPLTYTVDSATQITATVPAGLTANTYHITVTNAYGTSATSAADQFTVTDPLS
ncbi:MAG: IPT/TIG domain-containing protein, partial [Candidatus Margulisiibacteriota bacterium]